MVVKSNGGRPGWEYKESKPRGTVKREKPYVWNKPKPLMMNVYLLDEEDLLMMILKDRRIKEGEK